MAVEPEMNSGLDREMVFPGGESDCVIRTACSSDYERISNLAGQLGYPSGIEDVRRRLAEMRDTRRSAVYVAEDLQLQVIGWIGAFISTSVVEDKHAEISGLIVDQMTRSHGVGAKLLWSAEQWARANGCRNLLVRSNVIRERAHRFYLEHDYQIAKFQKIFVKLLDQRGYSS
jgi:GNAT superfamily N-acetyltransferase